MEGEPLTVLRGRLQIRNELSFYQPIASGSLT